MGAGDLFALLPFLIVVATALAVLSSIAVRRSHAAAAGLTVAGLALALVSLAPVARVVPWPATSLVMIDLYALVYFGLLLSAALVVAVLSHGYLARQDALREEYYVLLLLATLGAMTLAAATHFASFFLGLELLSVSLYAMIAFLHARPASIEAGMKYLVLAGASSAFLLFGMALVYADLGRMDFGGIASMLLGRGGDRSWVGPGLGLVFVGIGFKLAVAPFHLWTPDVYEGAPAPVTAFVATVSKGGMVALLVRFFAIVGVGPALWTALAVVAGLSMSLGNLLALLQGNVKRLLAYSSIAHMGYLLVAFLVGGRLGVEAATFSLVAYFVTTLAAFGVVAVLSGSERDADRLEDVRGLFWRRPFLAATLAAALLSLAGIPLTGGFVAKLYLVAAGVRGALWTLVALLAVNSVVGLYYYLRVLVAMAAEPAPEAGTVSGAVASISLAASVVLALLVLALVWLGVWPGPVLSLIHVAAGI